MRKKDIRVYVSFNSDSRVHVKGEDFWESAKRIAEDVGIKKRDFRTFLDIHKGRHESYRDQDMELFISDMEGRVLREKELNQFALRAREFEEIAEVFERAENAYRLEVENEALRDANKLVPAEEWHEDDGDVIWWKLPIEEPPYIGSPLCNDFTLYYYTHFTRLVTPIDNNE